MRKLKKIKPMEPNIFWIKYSDVSWRKEGLCSAFYFSPIWKTQYLCQPHHHYNNILTLDPSNNEAWPTGTLWAPRADTLGSPLQCKFSSLFALIVNDFHFKTPKALVVLPWYWALKPLNLWLPSDVKCSRSQFLLLIMGEGRLGPVNLQRKSRGGFTIYYYHFSIYNISKSILWLNNSRFCMLYTSVLLTP